MHFCSNDHKSKQSIAVLVCTIDVAIDVDPVLFHVHHCSNVDPFSIVGTLCIQTMEL